MRRQLESAIPRLSLAGIVKAHSDNDTRYKMYEYPFKQLDFDGVTLVAIVCASRVVSDRHVERVTDDGRFRQYPSGGDMRTTTTRTD